jgi:hypothetical protein
MEAALRFGGGTNVNTQLLWGIVVVAAAVAVIAWLLLRKRRTERLRDRFGPEYDRAVRDKGEVRKAEAALEARQARVARLHIRPLESADATRFSREWRSVQALFVDDPKAAITNADRLVGEVMRARGYPVGDFEQRVEDISVDHPDVVRNYRAAHDIALDHASGRTSTEDLRQAMVHYRALFTDLLGAQTAERLEKQPVLAERGRA